MDAPARLAIRPEEPEDQETIRLLVTEAFGRDGEAELVDGLRRDGDLVLSLLATDQEGSLCGHLALSRLKSPENALALAPVAVSPPFQRRGIGSRLVRAALTRAQQQGFSIVFVLGDPAYYTRFGFTAQAAELFSSPYSGPCFMALRLNGQSNEPSPVIYADAFGRLG
ncbi:GNAT family N-acetyltransferase [Indioceanicola profundi]|uniref:GNAT family N-acetyltransferase n=1 Tax=Indioceanicola profundi TaxID=2220096 RepID=UPI000E6A9C15|nr:N-acetyltransferase [Indioceanicola profundi]